MDRLFATQRSVDSPPVGSPGRRLGNARTWRLVHRCSPFRQEAYRDSGSVVVLIPLERVVPRDHDLVDLRGFHLGLCATATGSRISGGRNKGARSAKRRTKEMWQSRSM